MASHAIVAFVERAEWSSTIPGRVGLHSLMLVLKFGLHILKPFKRRFYGIVWHLNWLSKNIPDHAGNIVIDAK